MREIITKLIFLFTLLACISLVHTSQANNLRITNMSVDQTAGTVTFDIGWENSWRIDSIGAPYHWDAAWVFVKFRPCDALAALQWTHGLVDPTTASHTFGTLEPVLSDGSAVGIDAVGENNGIMLRQDQNGIFPSRGNTTVTLALTNLPAAGTDLEIKVFGIEMVHVPEAPFTIGAFPSSSAFQVAFGSGVAERMPGIMYADTAVDVYWYSNQQASLPAAFPTGYSAYHTMKYEISQGQYTEYLNTIPAAMATARWYNHSNQNHYRYRINNTGTAPNIYTCDRPNRACNYLHWFDLLSYLDWAALSPMSELEFEKTCRGTGSYVEREYPWGVAGNHLVEIHPADTIFGAENGTEYIDTNSGTNMANCHYTNGPLYLGDRFTLTPVNNFHNYRGPVRCGVFARPNATSRSESGATFYGALDMGGNVFEQCVAVRNDATTLAFAGTNGDGYLDATGLADVADWPYRSGTTAYRALRGGNFSSWITQIEMANRQFAWSNDGGATSKDNTTGGRGVRR